MEHLLPGVELVNGDCAAALPELRRPNLILTSPPYDGLRDYDGYVESFDFPAVVAAVTANLAPGGVLVWVVRDAVVDGGETGTSFRQALAFMGLGLRLHQTLIYQHWSLAGMRPTAYFRDFEYMFVFSREAVKANLLQDKPNSKSGCMETRTSSGRVGDVKTAYSWVKRKAAVPEHSRRGSVWCYAAGYGQVGNREQDPKLLYQHPAIFPVALARDHILTWTNPCDLVIDPMAGNGTTLRAAADLER